MWAEYFTGMFKTSEIEDTSYTDEKTYQRAETQTESPNLEEILEANLSLKITKHKEQT
jgi:hypothetical protein